MTRPAFIRHLLASLILVITVSIFPAQTSIPAGNLNGTLSLSGSPYLIQGHVIVQPNTLLRIDPGVVIEFQGHYKLNVQGRILAAGTPVDSIRFRVAPGLTATGWWGIRFEQTPVSQDSSVFTYCSIKNGITSGTTGEDGCYGGGIFIKRFSKVRVCNNLITGNDATYGGGIYLSHASPVIRYNSITSNSGQGRPGWGGPQGAAGICCDSSSSPDISYNILSANTATNSSGGGITCLNNSAPAIHHNTISNNLVRGNGSGIFCNASSPHIWNNTITYNQSGYGGAGIFSEESTGSIEDNIITYNHSISIPNNTAGYAGGVAIQGSAANIRLHKNLISNNISDTYAGGLLITEYPIAAVTENTIHGNVSGWDAGGMQVVSRAPGIYISKNVISNNISGTGSGGGVSFYGSENCVFTNNIVVNNRAEQNGGGIYFGSNSVSLTISNCIIANNKGAILPSSAGATYGGGGIYCSSGNRPAFRNCIVYGNVADNTYGDQVYIDNNTSIPAFYNCDVAGSSTAFYTNGSVYAGTYTGNIASDPLFILASSGAGPAFNGQVANWNLQSASPCINAGTHDTTGCRLPQTDMAGNPRITGYIDMGAYESSSCAGYTVNTSVSTGAGTFSANATGVYQWCMCSGLTPINGMTGAVFTPSVNGSYALKITENGCTGFSDCFSINDVGIDSHLSGLADPGVYPNPSHEKVTVNNLPAGIKEITVTDILSAEIYNCTTDNDSIEILIHTKGIYFLKIRSGQNACVKRIIID